MKCPLLGTMRTAEYKNLHPVFADCIKEECAWWDNTQGWCIIRAINMELVNLFVVLSEIKEKMPHAGQFKK